MRGNLSAQRGNSCQRHCWSHTCNPHASYSNTSAHTSAAEAAARLPVVLQESSGNCFCFNSKQVTIVSAVHLQITSIKTSFMCTKLFYHIDENLE